MTRMIHDPSTREYVAKRTQEGRSYREIRRSLQRYIARILYRQLNTLYATPVPAPTHSAWAETCPGQEYCPSPAVPGFGPANLRKEVRFNGMTAVSGT